MLRPEVEQHLPELRELCVKHGVSRLWVFGSAASNDPSAFDPARSDVDLLVSFADTDLGPWMSRYFQFRDACEQALRRRVDLMLESAPNRRQVRDAILKTRVPVYAAA